MTTYTTFAPSALAPFQFQPTLDGAVYSASVVWSLAGNRWYLRVDALDGTNVCTLPLIGSPDGVPISGITTDPISQIATVITAVAHTFATGSVVNLTLSGATPDAYNGQNEFSVINATTLTFQETTILPDASVGGSLFYNVNLVGGYFTTSTLVYRASTRQFEVSP